MLKIKFKNANYLKNKLLEFVGLNKNTFLLKLKDIGIQYKLSWFRYLIFNQTLDDMR